MPQLKFFFCLLMIGTAFVACKSDDDGSDQEEELIGVWQRSDASDIFELQLTFHNDNSGSLMSLEEDPINQTSTSSIQDLEWSTNGNLLTFSLSGNEAIVTPYSINSEGQLVLSAYSELPFNRLEN